MKSLETHFHSQAQSVGIVTCKFVFDEGKNSRTSSLLGPRGVKFIIINRLKNGYNVFHRN
jgi:hypothetical protein